MINREQFENLAKLARIKFTEDEYKKFSSQIEGVLDYMNILNEVDTSVVLPTDQVNGLSNILDQDGFVQGQASGSDLLNCSTLPVDSNQIRVLKVIK